MILTLSIILFILCILVGGSRGLKSFIVLFLDIAFCMINIILIGTGFPVVISTFILCLILAYIILYFVNGYNKKTIASFYSTVIILSFLMLSVFIITYLSKIQGFGIEYIEEIGWCNYAININLVHVTISSIIISLIGSIVDSSTAVSTAVYEVYDKNPQLTFKELYKSGITVGKDIISTITNTLFFAFLGGFVTLLIWFNYYSYDFTLIINNKVFAAEFISIMFNALGSLFIIPVTNYITCFLLIRKDNKFVKRIENRIEKRNEDE
ncbi:MAG: YibE/F family protein [Firmicutes bacterium]|nr:YibE/F family protein [Bacillota bacterium]